ncbi:hypothetical protein G6T08_002058 [Salmonella enterica]|nr:hypothetical protein [Salmonella enterica]ECB2071603.1 hypothetical protein [Salmonella enterica subsp. enterica serovar Benin]MKU01546.1 hypothetical protein [Salmonella enterica subsp. enterica serovar Kinondoni]EBE6989452.1 hypothetical protein [Salmonella enterica]EBE7297921.1 hypothetical protein [Salmonella enterica]
MNYHHGMPFDPHNTDVKETDQFGRRYATRFCTGTGQRDVFPAPINAAEAARIKAQEIAVAVSQIVIAQSRLLTSPKDTGLNNQLEDWRRYLLEMYDITPENAPQQVESWPKKPAEVK